MVEDSFIQTEEYILLEEQQLHQRERQYGKKREKAIELVNAALATKNMCEIQAVLDYFEDKELVKALSEVNEIAFIIVMLDIYNMESEAGVKNTIFNWADDLEAIITIIRQVKFLLWEMEFLNDAEAGNLLSGYLRDMGISMPALEYIVFISCYDKQKMVKYLEDLFS